MDPESDTVSVSQSRKAFKTRRNKLTEDGVEFALAQFRRPECANDVVKRCAGLYMLQASFAKSPLACVAEKLYSLGFLGTLTEIISTPNDKNNSPFLCAMATDMLYQFSRMTDKAHVKPLADDAVISALCRLLNTKGDFFRYSRKFQDRLCSLIQDTQFAQQRVVPISVDKAVWSDILQSNPQMALYGAIQIVYECDVRFTGQVAKHDDTKEFCIARRLISEKLAWKPLNVSKDDDKTPLFNHIEELVRPADYQTAAEKELIQLTEDLREGALSEDICVLDMIGGRYFWAYVGKGNLSNIEVLCNVLEQELPNFAIARIPQAGNLVIVECLDESEQTGRPVPRLFRGRLLEIAGEQVKAFALDFGRVVTVKQCRLYDIRGSSKLLGLEPQAQVCRLAGVQATPIHEVALEQAMCTLINVTKHFTEPGLTFLSKGVDFLNPLILSAPPEIQLQAVRLLGNVTSNSRVSRAHDWKAFIRPQLGSLAYLSKEEGADIINRNLLISSLHALTNILIMKPVYHDYFFEMQGTAIVLNIMRLFKSSLSIVKAAAGVLNAAFPDFHRTYPRTAAKGLAKGSEDAEEEEEDSFLRERVSAPPKQQVVPPPRDVLTPSRRQGNPNTWHRQQAERRPPQLPSLEELSLQEERRSIPTSNDRGDDDDGEDDNSSEPMNAVGGDVNTSSVRTDRAEPTTSVVPVDGLTVIRENQAKEKKYLLNSYLDLRDDGKTHLLIVPNQSIKQTSQRKLCELIISFLNSSGGAIYIGIDKTGCVVGVKMDRSERDSVRLGIDGIMNKVTPVIPHNQLQLEFHKVYQMPDGQTVLPCDNIWVMAIILKAPRDFPCYTLEKGTLCFIRHGPNNQLMKEKDVRELVASEVELQYIEELRALEQRLAELKAELGEDEQDD